MKIETTVRLRGTKNACDIEENKRITEELDFLDHQICDLQNTRLGLVSRIEENSVKDELLASFDTYDMTVELLEMPAFEGDPLQIALPGTLSHWVPFNEANLIKAIQMKYNRICWEKHSDGIAYTSSSKDCNCEPNVCLKTCKGCK